MPSVPVATTQTDRTRWLLFIGLGLLAGYLLLSLSYANALPLCRDQMTEAYNAWRHVGQQPDGYTIPKYKSFWVYRIMGLGGLLAADAWQKIMAMRLQLVIVNTFGLTACWIWWRRWFDDRAVLMGLALLICQSTFLEHALEVRADMYGVWPAMAGWMLLLGRRYGLAGAMMALAFTASPKIAYHIVAIEGLLLIRLLQKHHVRSAMAHLLWFNALLIITGAGLYLPETLMYQYVPSARVAGRAGRAVRHVEYLNYFWVQSFVRNPLFWAMALGGIMGLNLLGPWLRPRPRLKVHADVGLLSLILSALAWRHPELFPYFFCSILPFLTLAIVAWSDRLLLSVEHWPKLHRHMLVVILILLGLALPLSRVPINLQRRALLVNQQCTVTGLEALTKACGSYLTIRPVAPGLAYQPLAQWDRPGFTPLWQDPRQTNPFDRLAACTGARVLLDDPEIKQLSPAMQEAVSERFRPIAAALSSWTIRIPAGEKQFNVPVNGWYRIKLDESVSCEPIICNDQPRSDGEMVQLQSGRWYPVTPTDRDIYLQWLGPRRQKARQQARPPQRLFPPDLYTY